MRSPSWSRRKVVVHSVMSRCHGIGWRWVVVLLCGAFRVSLQLGVLIVSVVMLCVTSHCLTNMTSLCFYPIGFCVTLSLLSSCYTAAIVFALQYRLCIAVSLFSVCCECPDVLCRGQYIIAACCDYTCCCHGVVLWLCHGLILASRNYVIGSHLVFFTICDSVIVSWRHGITVSRCYDVMTSQCHGVMVSLCQSMVVSWYHALIVVSCCHFIIYNMYTIVACFFLPFLLLLLLVYNCNMCSISYHMWW